MSKIYLDYAATTPIREEVIESYYKLLKENYGNSDYRTMQYLAFCK